MTNKIKLPYRILFLLIALFALIWYFFQMVVFRAYGITFANGFLNYISYFTIQSNWLVAFWWSIAILKPKSPILQPKIKGAFTTYITVTLAGYAALLASTWNPQGVDLLLSSITHYVTPLAFILDWFLFEQRSVYQWRFLIAWLPYPLLYFGYAMLHGTLTGNFLYPFFDYNALGWKGLAIQALLLLIFFLLVACFYIGVNKRWKTSQKGAI